jgi:endonuclease/exonuclease/phosphatase family metal-dependent hydrolase
MNLKIGTFNLNNLFSRYNFTAEVDPSLGTNIYALKGKLIEFDTQQGVFREYKGKIVKGKESKESKTIAERILEMNVDVLAVQEVENIETLNDFNGNKDFLDHNYKYTGLIEGNDDRLIDIGILSKLPIGSMTSWKHWHHPERLDKPVFSRDLLEVEILDPSREKLLVTLLINHLKSRFIDPRKDKDERVKEEKENNTRRRQQAEMIRYIVKSKYKSTDRFIILGDMNDPPDSPCLTAISQDGDLKLVDAMKDPKETRPYRDKKKQPTTTAWTNRYIPGTGMDPEYTLFDQIWVSPPIADVITGSWVHRREHAGGDGSDHDPAWIELNMNL